MESPRTSTSTDGLSLGPASTGGRYQRRTESREQFLPGAGLEDRLRNPNGLGNLGDVVDSQHVRASSQRQDVARDRAAQSFVDLPAGEGADEALAGRSDDDRPPEAAQLTEAAQQLDVVASGLSESDSRIDPDAVLGYSLAYGELDPLGEKRPHVINDVVVGRAFLHRPWRSLHVHQHDDAPTLRPDPGKSRLEPQRGH